MSVLARLLIVIEALVCFGPLLFLLCLGVLLVPIWIIGLTLDPPGPEPRAAWDSVYSLLLVILGSCGALGLTCAVVEIISGKRWFRWLTMPLIALGIAAVLMLNWPWIPTIFAGEMSLDALWPLLLYLGLPIGCSVHFLWLLSRKPKAISP